MKNVFSIIIVLLLAACSGNGRGSYANELQSWVGRSEYQLYRSWGQPANVFYVAPNQKVVTYVTSSTQEDNNPYSHQLYYGGMGEDNSWWDKLFGPPGAGEQPKIYYCKTSFVIQNSVIVNFNFNGDDCVTN